MRENNQNHPLSIAIGGGKGGVGKSMISSNLAVQYAQANLRVILLDLDFGAANLHTIFGIRNPPKGIGDFFQTKRANLTDYIIDTEIPNLRLIPGTGFVPELAQLKHPHKVKLKNQLRQLDADIILLDLGAGTSNHTLDFFVIADMSLVVTTPEPTSIVNAYEFLKNIIYRILFRMFKKQPKLLQILKESVQPNSSQNIPELIEKIGEKNRFAATTIKDICQDLNLGLVFNQARKMDETHLGLKLKNLSNKFLNINLHFLGMVFHSYEVSSSVFKMKPISADLPDSTTSQTLQRLAVTLLEEMSKKEKSEEDHSWNRLLHFAKQDFQKNTLESKRVERETKQFSLNEMGIDL